MGYTIVQPASLTEAAGIGKVSFGSGNDTTNPIPDVAQVLADVLDADNTIGKVIMMRSGETPIADAVKNV